jgi:ribosome-associated protein
MLIISPSIRIPDNEISFEYMRSSGPGGQHVNKTSTAVQLRFDIANSCSLPGGVKRRLIQLGGSRVTAAGELIITARRFRSQDANRRDALERLRGLVLRSLRPVRSRRRTAVPRASRLRRLHDKSMRSQLKKKRSRVGEE